MAKRNDPLSKENPELFGATPYGPEMTDEDPNATPYLGFCSFDDEVRLCIVNAGRFIRRGVYCRRIDVYLSEEGTWERWEIWEGHLTAIDPS